MTHESLRLYTYWRSSAAYRVRIGLNLKGLHCEQVPVHLVRDGGEQHAPAYQAINPQELVPVLGREAAETFRRDHGGQQLKRYDGRGLVELPAQP